VLNITEAKVTTRHNVQPNKKDLSNFSLIDRFDVQVKIKNAPKYLEGESRYLISELSRIKYKNNSVRKGITRTKLKIQKTKFLLRKNFLGFVQILQRQTMQINKNIELDQLLIVRKKIGNRKNKITSIFDRCLIR